MRWSLLRAVCVRAYCKSQSVRISADSQHAGAAVAGSPGAPSNDRWRHLHTVLARVCLTICVGFAVTTASAQTIQYLYDESGRLVGTVAPTGESAFYSYDPAGNITSTRRVMAGAIAIAEFTPNSGTVGSTVTIWGSGFSTTASQNVVRFNGTGATVTSATANKLVVTVPAAATTGPVSVTSPNGSATSTTSFSVLANSGAPTIAGFTPTVGSPGTMVTITGTNFDPAVGSTRVEFNGQTGYVSSAAATTLNTAVPIASTGRIRVATPGGSVLSAADFVILPSGINADDILVSRRATVGGTAQTLDINTAYKVGVLLFDGQRNQYVTIDLTAFTPNPGTAPVPFRVYAPSGRFPMLSGNTSSTARTIHLPRLPLTGTYAVYFIPVAVFAATVNLSATVGLDATVAANGTVLTSLTSFAGQTKRVTFSGTAGRDLTSYVSSVSMAGLAWLSHQLKRPEGAALTNNSCVPGDRGCELVSHLLPSTGTYEVVFVPSPAATTGTGSFGIQVWESSRVTGTLTVGTQATYTSTVPGQVVQYAFAGTAGDQRGLTLSNFTTSVSGAWLTVKVLNPNSSQLISATFTASPTNVLDLPALPATGSYTVQIYPYHFPNISRVGDLTTTFSGQVLVTADVSATLATNGTAASVSLAQPGQTARLSLYGTAGRDLTLYVSSWSITGTSLNYQLRKPDGTTLTSNNCLWNGSGCAVAWRGLPVTGTYEIVLAPSPAATTGSFSVQAWESSRVTGTLTAGTQVTYTSTVPGQVVQYAFSGTAGQQLGLTLSNFTTSVAGASLTVQVLKPDNSLLTSGTFTASQTTPTAYVLALPVLPSTGSYTVNVLPNPYTYTNQMTTTFSGRVLMTASASGSLATDGTTTPIVLAQPGQTARLTFSGTAGRDLTWYVSSVSMTGLTYLNYQVKKPDGSTLTSSNCYPTGSGCALAWQALPVTGTYEIVFTPSPAATTGSYSVQAWESSRVTGGTLTVDTQATCTSTVPGQVVEYTFSGTAGQQLGLTLSNFTTSVSGARLTATVLKPDSSVLTSASVLATITVPGYGIDIPLLPTTGTYTVRVSPYNIGNADLTTTFSGQLRLTTDVAGTLATDGTATAVAIAQLGQTARLTFSGVAGQDWTLNLSALAMSGSSPYIGYTVHRPDGTYLTGDNCYPDGSRCSVVVYGLPVTGTYSIVLTPYSGGYIPGSSTGTFTVKSWASNRVTGTLTVGTQATVVTTVPGQVAQYTFSGTAGQQLRLNLSNFSMSVSGAYVRVDLLSPDNSFWASATINAASTVPVWAVVTMQPLPSTGTYTLRIAPYNGQVGNLHPITTFSGQVLLAEASGLPTDGTTRSVSLSQSGQVAALAFPGTAGMDWVMKISGLSLSGTNPSVAYSLKHSFFPSFPIATGTCTTTGLGCFVGGAGFRLPYAGTYTLEFNANPPGSIGTFNVNAWMSNRLVGSLTRSVASTFATAVPGQVVEYSFQGDYAGQLLDLVLANVSTSSTGARLAVYVEQEPYSGYSAYALVVATDTSPSPYVFNLPALPGGGTYKVLFYPYSTGSTDLTITFGGQVTVRLR